MKAMIYMKQGVLAIGFSLLLGGWWGSAQTATLDIGAGQPSIISTVRQAVEGWCCYSNCGNSKETS